MYELYKTCGSCFASAFGDFVSESSFKRVAYELDLEAERNGWRDGICPECLKRGEEHADGKP